MIIILLSAALLEGGKSKVSIEARDSLSRLAVKLLLLIGGSCQHDGLHRVWLLAAAMILNHVWGSSHGSRMIAAIHE